LGVLVGGGGQDTLLIQSSNVTLDINDFGSTPPAGFSGYSTIQGFNSSSDIIVIQGQASQYSLSHVGNNDILAHNGIAIATIQNSNLGGFYQGFHFFG
jgi:hypothetical protein